MRLSTFTKAGLLQREVAHVVGVCRATVNRWFRERTEPHHLVNSKLQEVIGRVERAVDTGELPFPPTMSKDKRLEQLEEIVERNDE